MARKKQPEAIDTEAFDAVISIRLSNRELGILRRLAANDGRRTLSNMVRKLIADAHASLKGKR